MTRSTTPLLAHSPGHAAIAVSALHAAEIPATIADDHFQRIYPGLGLGALRPRILVPPACEAEARAIIAQAQAATEEPLYPCPRCGGETHFHRRSLRVTLRLVLTGAFKRLFSVRRHCADCEIDVDAPVSAPFTEEELGYSPEG